MKHLTLMMTFGAGIVMTAAAAAQDMPKWSLAATCAGDADPAACRAFEGNTYSRLSGIWQSIPGQLRSECLEDAKSFGHKSYRLLKDCLEDHLIKHQREAVKGEPAASKNAPPKGTPTWVIEDGRLLYTK